MSNHLTPAHSENQESGTKKVYAVPESYSKKANMNFDQYQEWYSESIRDPASFWAARAEETLTFDQPWSQVVQYDFKKGQASWFIGATLNITTNCIDRHLPQRAQQTAIIWEGDEPDQDLHISYQMLKDEVCKFSNVLKSRGVQKGDRVCIYMPMIPEAAYAMLACARIGAIHSVVFGGFSPEALKDRILDAACTCVITADEGIRGGKRIPLKQNTDQALSQCPDVQTLVVVKHSGGSIAWQASRDIWYHEAASTADTECPAEPMNAEDPLFILYTSGSTGKPKGVMHTTAGYLLQAALTHQYVLDYRAGDVYWCTADVGWITGHSYIVYGPLANGATTLMFAGVPTYPSVSRCWEIVDKHQVNTFYTAPTAIRALMAQGDAPVKQCQRSSLRLLGTVGEPINPEAWEWYHRVVGDGRCPIVDTWWQTETGAIMIAPIPGAIDLKPGSATLPFFGVEPVLMDSEGNELCGEATGNLAIKQSWPSQIRTVFGDHARCIETYYSTYPNHYFTGDGARRDADGYFWITGRVDDVLNVSGHRLGTAEIESALVLHEAVAEAAVVGYPHDIKGQGIFAYVSLMQGRLESPELLAELRNWVAKEIGAIAKPDRIQWAPNLPKTRSGKIMRRILRKIAGGEYESLGDISTLADPSAVDSLVTAAKAAQN